MMMMMMIIITYFVHLVQHTFHNKTYVREHIKSKNTEYSKFKSGKRTFVKSKK